MDRKQVASLLKKRAMVGTLMLNHDDVQAGIDQLFGEERCITEFMYDVCYQAYCRLRNPLDSEDYDLAEKQWAESGPIPAVTILQGTVSYSTDELYVYEEDIRSVLDSMDDEFRSWTFMLELASVAHTYNTEE